MQDPTFQKAEEAARNYYLSTIGQTLGQVTEIRFQLAIGINYHIVFQGI